MVVTCVIVIIIIITTITVIIIADVWLVKLQHVSFTSWSCFVHILGPNLQSLKICLRIVVSLVIGLWQPYRHKQEVKVI